jgi:hypothetical protein
MKGVVKINDLFYYSSQIAIIGTSMAEASPHRERIEHVGPYIPGSILGEASAYGMHVEGDVIVQFVEVDMFPLGVVRSGDTLIVSRGLPDNGPDDEIPRTKSEFVTDLLRAEGVIDKPRKKPYEQLRLFKNTTCLVAYEAPES